MNQELPRIVCGKCYTSQQWRNQVDCANCGKRLNDWSVASQLAAQGAIRGQQQIAPVHGKQA